MATTCTVHVLPCRPSAAQRRPPLRATNPRRQRADRTRGRDHRTV